MSKEVLRFKLESDGDVSPSGLRTTLGAAVVENGMLVIHVDGFGNRDGDSDFDNGIIVALCLQDGRLRLMAWPRYDDPAPVTTEMSGAKVWGK